MGFCMHCGAALVPNAKFCAECGAPIAPEVAAPAPAPQPAVTRTVPRSARGWRPRRVPRVLRALWPHSGVSVERELLLVVLYAVVLVLLLTRVAAR